MICVAAVFLLQVQTGRIQVSAIDPTDAPVHAQIQVLHRDSGETVASGQASQDRGLYLSPPLAAGSYQVRVKMAGFRTQVFNDVQVLPGQTRELPPVALKFQSCDSPGMNCFDLGPPRKSDTWGETLRVGCPIDFDRKSKKKCATKATADLRVELQEGKMYFVATNGAQFSQLNPASQSCKIGPYTEDRIRVDDLGSGFDLCVKTKLGKILTAFFMDEVSRGESKILLRFVALP